MRPAHGSGRGFAGFLLIEGHLYLSLNKTIRSLLSIYLITITGSIPIENLSVPFSKNSRYPQIQTGTVL